LAERQTQGFLQSIFELMKIDLIRMIADANANAPNESGADASCSACITANISNNRPEIQFSGQVIVMMRFTKRHKGETEYGQVFDSLGIAVKALNIMRR
jgi:hypothetical protein